MALFGCRESINIDDALKPLADECRNHVVRLAWKKAETVRTLLGQSVHLEQIVVCLVM